MFVKNYKNQSVEKIVTHKNYENFGMPYFPSIDDVSFILKVDQQQARQIHDQIQIKYANYQNFYIQAAKDVANQESGCSWWNTGAVIVDNLGQIIAQGANSGQNYIIPCLRYQHNCSSGKGYKYCRDECIQTSHAEVSAINNLSDEDKTTPGKSLYLFGHYWCCQSCWQAMISAGIYRVCLLLDAQNIFDGQKRRSNYQKIWDDYDQEKKLLEQISPNLTHLEKTQKLEEIARLLSQWKI